MSTDWLSEAQGIAGEIEGLRRAFHRRPELGNREYETAARVEETLKGCGIAARRLLDTAVIGRLEGALPGRTAALRADMDALPLTEATGADFASQNPGVMHACGHDVHLAAALGAAKLLAARRERLPGSVVFLFQPDEEGDGGAERLIDAGALDGVDAVFGAHVSPDLPAGCAGVRFGKFYAASDMFRVAVHGRSAHGAEREKGLDALAAAAQMVGDVLALPGRLPEGERGVVSVGTFRSGTAGNIVADAAEFTGIIRTLGPRARAMLRGGFEAAVRSVARRYGAEVECIVKESYPGVVNDNAITALARRAMAALLGADRVYEIAEPTMTTEDFGYYLMKRPGSYYHVGAGCGLPVHNPGFLPDEGAAVTAAAVHAAVLWTFLTE